MAEDIPVSGPGGPPRRDLTEAEWTRTRTPPPYEMAAPVGFRRVSWGAIFAGLVVAMVVELALSTLGLAVGLGALNPATAEQPFQGMGTGTGIWLAITTFIALFCGGMTAARFAGVPRRIDGVLHGIVTWGLVTLLSTWMLTSAVGQVLSGAIGVVGAGLGLVGQGVSAIAPAAIGAAGQQIGAQNLTPQNIGQEIERFLRQTGDPALQPEALQRNVNRAGETVQRAAGEAAQAPQTAGAEISAALQRVVAQGRGVVNQVDRQDAINVIVARTGKSEAEAGQIVDNWVVTWNNFTQQVGTTAQQAGRTAVVVTQQVTDTLGQVAAWGFVAMVLGVLAASWGGSVGTPKQVTAVALEQPSATVHEH